jgi:hypothetical protein
MNTLRMQFINLSHFILCEKVINPYAKYKIGVRKMNTKNSGKKVPSQVNPIVFSNQLNEVVKNKMVVKEL